MLRLGIARPALLIPLIASCSDSGGPICTADTRPAVEVVVTDRVSSGPIPELARGIVQDGEFQDSLQLNGWIPEDPIVPTRYAAAFERVGTYTVHLEIAGYQPWDTGGIRVTRDECHVLTVTLDAALSQSNH
jgi:hypothetical protein